MTDATPDCCIRRLCLHSFDKNHLPGEEVLKCVACSGIITPGDYVDCALGCSAFFCYPCAGKHFEDDICCKLESSPTHPSAQHYIKPALRDFRLQTTMNMYITSKYTKPKKFDSHATYTPIAKYFKTKIQSGQKKRGS